MLVRTDPFREFDRLAQQMLGQAGTTTRPTAMAMDAWRRGSEFVLEFDLPGIDPGTLDLDVERNVLTIHAERPPLADSDELLAAERPRGIFSRQLVLGDNVDLDNIQAEYRSGVLALRIPVAEHAKPRKIKVSASDEDHHALTA